MRTRRRWPPPPGRRPSPAGPGGHDQRGRLSAGGYGQVIGSGGRVPQGAGDPSEAGRRQPRRHRIPQPPGGQPRHLGWLLHQTGKTSEAEAEYRKALAIQQKLADDNPAVTDFRSSLAISHNILGNLLAVTGRSSEAEAEYRKALAIQQKLADDNPAVTEFRNRLAISHNNLGNLLSDTGKPSEAEAEYRKALAIHQKLADDNPAVTEFRGFLAASHANLGGC